MADDRDLTANCGIANIVDAEGNPQRLAANQAQFDHNQTALGRAPQFAEHTGAVLRDLMLSDERLIDLNTAGAIT